MMKNMNELDMIKWEAYCKAARKTPGMVPIVICTPEGGRVFTFVEHGHEKEAKAAILKDFSKGGIYEEMSDACNFLCRLVVSE